MTIEETREYWSKRLERTSEFSNEYLDEEERHAYADYIDALKHAIMALAICREREDAAKQPKTNGDKIRAMTDEELADWLTDGHDKCDICKLCSFGACRIESECEKGVLEWLKQEVSEDAGTD